MKTHFPFLCTLAVISFLFYSCEEKELIQTDVEQDASIVEIKTPNVIRTNLLELDDDDTFTTLLFKLSKKNDSKAGARDMEKKNGFTIEPGQVIKIVKDGTTSYTMKVKSKTVSVDYFENLVTEIDTEGNVNAFLLTYELIDYHHESGDFQYKGPIKITPVSSVGLTAKWACISVTILYCDWDDNTHGDVHLAGENCTPGYIFEDIKEICFDDGTGYGGGGSNSGPSIGGDGNYGGGAGSGTQTTSVYFDDEFPVREKLLKEYLKMNLITQRLMFKTQQNYGVVNAIYSILTKNNGTIDQASVDQAQRIVDFLKVNNFSEEAKLRIKEVRDALVAGTLVSAIPLVKYPPNSNYSSKYKKLTEYLQNQLPTIADNTTIINAIKKYTNLTAVEIQKELKWGDGPIIRIEQLGGTTYGKFKKDADPNSIFFGY